MDEEHSELPEMRAQGLARLAALQRLREQATHGSGRAMLDSVEKLIEQETKSLRESRSTDAERA